MGSKTLPRIFPEGLATAPTKIESRRGCYTLRFSMPG